MANSKTQDLYFADKVDAALHTRDRTDEKISKWLTSKMSLGDIRAGKLVLPVTVRDWSYEEGANPTQLPPAQIIINTSRTHNPEQSNERLLSRRIWQVIAALDPPVDGAYVRTHLNRDIPEIRLTPSSAEPKDAMGVEATIFKIRMRRANLRRPVSAGSITMRFVETPYSPYIPATPGTPEKQEKPGTRQAWLDSFRPSPDVADRGAVLLAAHVAAAEIAHSEWYTLRTPRGRAVAEIFHQTWQALAESQDGGGLPVVLEEQALTPSTAHPGAYAGRLVIPPRTLTT